MTTLKQTLATVVCRVIECGRTIIGDPLVPDINDITEGGNKPLQSVKLEEWVCCHSCAKKITGVKFFPFSEAKRELERRIAEAEEKARQDAMPVQCEACLRKVTFGTSMPDPAGHLGRVCQTCGKVRVTKSKGKSRSSLPLPKPLPSQPQQSSTAVVQKKSGGILPVVDEIKFSGKDGKPLHGAAKHGQVLKALTAIEKARAKKKQELEDAKTAAKLAKQVHRKQLAERNARMTEAAFGKLD